jgi:hypothetical protein
MSTGAIACGFGLATSTHKLPSVRVVMSSPSTRMVRVPSMV